MAAEFQIRFAPESSWEHYWFRIRQYVRLLQTYVGEDSRAVQLRGTEVEPGAGRWVYDVRLLPKEPGVVLLEVSAHPPSIERDLRVLITWMRELGDVRVEDDDGELVEW